MERLLQINWYRTNALLLVTLVSIIALKFAFAGQYLFHLAPCELCIYQRIPYAFVIFVGLIGIIVKTSPVPTICLALSGIAFFINSLIAAFHTGVEQGWWGGLASCGGDLTGKTSLEDLKATIMNAPIARCDEVPWSLFGISMAGYNVLICLGLALFILYALLSKKSKTNIERLK